MTTFNKSITNSLNLFGVSPTNKWGTMLWGDKWAEGNLATIRSVSKLFTDSITLTDSFTFIVLFTKAISNAITITGDMYSESVYDSNGYNRFFQISTNAENRPLTSYNKASNTSAFTTFTHSTTTWTVI